jgi:nitroreductase
MGGSSDEAKERTAWADTGFISQNVYLCCASEGLATVVRGLVDREALAPRMKLRADQRITLNLDDGVKVNYGKFGDLLAEVRAVTGKAPET